MAGFIAILLQPRVDTIRENTRLGSTSRAAADRVFHALADANRRAIIRRLTRGPATVSDLARLLGVTVAADHTTTPDDPSKESRS
jgi:DNA-binding transcriptional ArsR family regulator